MTLSLMHHSETDVCQITCVAIQDVSCHHLNDGPMAANALHKVVICINV